MLIKKTSDIKWSEVTPKSVYMNRRNFLTGAAVAAGAAFAAGPASSWLDPETAQAAGAKLTVASKSPFSTTEKETPYQAVTTYNNFYEFGTDKSGSGTLCHEVRNHTVDGERRRRSREAAEIFAWKTCMALAPLEERIYRHRCVEAWSIVVPWIGYSLSVLINKAQPTPKAKFVQFFSDADPKQMPGLRSRVLDWPYREGLRMDEAMHPLTTLCFGLYGEVLPNQNGAPLRT